MKKSKALNEQAAQHPKSEALVAWQRAWRSWSQTRTEQDFCEEDVREGRPLTWWHDTRKPFPVKRANALARACDQLAQEAMRHGLDPAPALRLAKHLRERSYSTRRTQDAVEMMAAALAVHIGASRSGEATDRSTPPAKPRPPRQDEIDTALIAALPRDGTSVRFRDLIRKAERELPHGFAMPTDSVVRKRLAALNKRGAVCRDSRGFYWHPQAQGRKGTGAQ